MFDIESGRNAGEVESKYEKSKVPKSAVRSRYLSFLFALLRPSGKLNSGNNVCNLQVSETLLQSTSLWSSTRL